MSLQCSYEWLGQGWPRAWSQDPRRSIQTAVFCLEKGEPRVFSSLLLHRDCSRKELARWDQRTPRGPSAPCRAKALARGLDLQGDQGKACPKPDAKNSLVSGRGSVKGTLKTNTQHTPTISPMAQSSLGWVAPEISGPLPPGAAGPMSHYWARPCFWYQIPPIPAKEIYSSSALDRHTSRNCGLCSRTRNKVNTAIKQVTQLFWFPSAYKSYVYTVL